MELIVHAHDVCAGLGITFEPPADLCRRLRDHTRSWPMWSSHLRYGLPDTDDAWGGSAHGLRSPALRISGEDRDNGQPMRIGDTSRIQCASSNVPFGDAEIMKWDGQRPVSDHLLVARPKAGRFGTFTGESAPWRWWSRSRRAWSASRSSRVRALSMEVVRSVNAGWRTMLKFSRAPASWSLRCPSSC